MDSNDGVFAAFLAAGVVYAVVVYLVVDRAERKRTQAWVAFAASIGCAFSAKDPFRMLRMRDHSIFQNGYTKRVTNVLHGHYRGHAVRSFDYGYTIRYGRNSRKHRLTLLMARAPVPFEPMLIRPEHLGDALAAVVGIDDTDFESEEFNRQFRVECADRRFAHDVLHPRMMEFLLRFPDLTVQVGWDNVVFFRAPRGYLQLPYQVRELMDLGCDFMDLLPEHLLRERAAADAKG